MKKKSKQTIWYQGWDAGAVYTRRFITVLFIARDFYHAEIAMRERNYVDIIKTISSERRISLQTYFPKRLTRRRKYE